MTQSKKSMTINGIAKKEDLVNNKQDKNKYIKSGVYFLFDKDEIVYVGKTINGFKRILSHTNSKEFDSFSFIDVEEHYLDEIETANILYYEPKYNKSSFLTGYKTETAINNLIKKFTGKRNIRKLHEAIERLNVKPVYCNGFKVYKDSDVLNIISEVNGE